MNALMPRFLSLLICILFSTGLPAVQRYQSSVDVADWKVISSPIQCEMVHDIDHYGQGRFIYSSGGELSFQLHSREAARQNSVASLYSFAPFWREYEEKELAQLTISKGNMPFYIGGSLAYRMLYELQAGRHPTFHYKDWAIFEDDVYVSVSSVKFHQHVDDFNLCISNALAYGSDQVVDTTLYFRSNKSGLSKKEKAKLREIILFARFDKAMKIHLKGHADGKGRRVYNKKLSERRSASVEKYLISEGVSDMQISQNSFGESQPSASNRSSRGRKVNRRVNVFIKHE